MYWNNPHTRKRESLSFATEAEAKKENSLIMHRLKHEREYFEKPEQAQEVNTLEMCYMQYLKEKKFNKKSLTCQLDCMKTPLKMLGAMDISTITKQNIVDVMNHMEAQNIKPVTVRGRMSVFRTVMRWAAEKEYCNALSFPRLPSAAYEKFVPPTFEEIVTMLSAAPPHIQRVIILGSQLGVRVGQSELLSLTWDDVDFAQATVRVHGAVKNKIQPWRHVPIRASLLPVFKAWKKEDGGHGYIVSFKGQRIESIKTAWRTMLKNAGITRRIRPYDLRHAFATEMIAGGVDVGTVSQLMGHTTPTMVLKHYQHVLDAQKRRAVDVLPDVLHVPRLMCQKEGVQNLLQ